MAFLINGANIKIGPAGSSGLGNLKGIEHCKELGLQAMEVEFTHGVQMGNSTAFEIGKLAVELGIDLSVHAPYFVNLTSLEKAKIEASKKRILTSCERANHLGAKNVIFHAAFYGKENPEAVYSKVKDEILEMMKYIKEKKWNVVLCPETTGKQSQFGTVDELMQLHKETGCGLCVDFAHIYARASGKIDYDEVFKKLMLEKASLKHIQAHFSGIEYGPKGERKHILTKKEFFRPLLDAIISAKANITIINESPDPLRDCVMMKKMVEEKKN